MKRHSNPRPSPAAGHTAADNSPPPPARPDDFHQGKAHVSNPAQVERSADDAAAGRAGKPAPEGNTPGGVSS